MNHLFLGHQHEPLSFHAKIILFFVLLIIISFAVSSILICYFCCGITNTNRLSYLDKDRKSSRKKNREILFLFNSSSHLDQAEFEETGAVATPLLSS